MDGSAEKLSAGACHSDKADGHRDSHNYPLVQKVAEASARLTVESLTKRSPIIKRLVGAKQLKIAAAMHDITTGRVTWLS